MKKKMKRFLALALALVTLSTCCVVPVAADSGDEQFTDDYDMVTIADLGGSEGADGKYTISSGTKTYEGNSATKSVVLKFGWEPKLSSGDWKLALDSYWNERCTVWFRSDGLFTQFAYSDWKKSDAVTDGTHEVEFGRLRVTSGANAGKDYVYLKIDGVVIDSNYTDYYQTDGGYNNAYENINPAYKVCLVGDAVAQQSFYLPERFTDEYDTVTIADLGGTEGTDGKYTISSGDKTYEGSSPTKSVIVKFGWEPKLSSGDWKLALDSYWNERYRIVYANLHCYRCNWFGSCCCGSRHPCFKKTSKEIKR